jgi:hypothetical protein
MRACGKRYKTVEEAQRSKAVVQLGGVIDPDCWCCHGVHVKVPKTTGESGAPEFTVRVKHLIRTRAGGGDPYDAVCEYCMTFIGIRGGEFQHRTARGAGGCRDTVINGPANGLLLCGSVALRTGCHWEAERRPAELGIEGHGLWIKHGTTPGFDPRNVGFLLHGATRRRKPAWLTEDGQYRYTAPGELAA